MTEETKVQGTKAKEFELTFLERMLLRNIYPVVKEYSSMMLRNKIMEKLIDEEEMKLRKVMPLLKCGECGRVVVSEPPLVCSKCKSEMQPTGQVRWISKDDEGKALPDAKTVTLGEMAWHTIEKTLKELNEAQELDPGYISLYEKFALNGDKPAISEDSVEEPPKIVKRTSKYGASRSQHE